MGAFIKFNKGMMKMPGYETSNWCARSHLHEEKDNHDGYARSSTSTRMASYCLDQSRLGHKSRASILEHLANPNELGL